MYLAVFARRFRQFAALASESVLCRYQPTRLRCRAGSDASDADRVLCRQLQSSAGVVMATASSSSSRIPSRYWAESWLVQTHAACIVHASYRMFLRTSFIHQLNQASAFIVKRSNMVIGPRVVCIAIRTTGVCSTTGDVRTISGKHTQPVISSTPCTITSSSSKLCDAMIRWF